MSSDVNHSAISYTLCMVVVLFFTLKKVLVLGVKAV